MQKRDIAESAADEKEGRRKMEMALVRIDDKFRVVIPKKLRESAGISEKSSMFLYTFEDIVLLRKVDTENGKFLSDIEKLRELGVV
jgi:AbrB family looped-hinge helix DNA binding protein